MRVSSRVRAAIASGDYLLAMEELMPLTEPVDRIFDDVLIMAPQPAVRANRLALLRLAVDVFRLDPHSSVLHRNHYAVRVVNLGVHPKHPRPILGRHRIDCIRDQVQEDLLHLNSIPLYRRQLFMQLVLD